MRALSQRDAWHGEALVLFPPCPQLRVRGSSRTRARTPWFLLRGQVANEAAGALDCRVPTTAELLPHRALLHPRF